MAQFEIALLELAYTKETLINSENLKETSESIIVAENQLKEVFQSFKNKAEKYCTSIDGRNN